MYKTRFSFYHFVYGKLTTPCWYCTVKPTFDLDGKAPSSLCLTKGIESIRVSGNHDIVVQNNSFNIIVQCIFQRCFQVLERCLFKVGSGISRKTFYFFLFWFFKATYHVLSHFALSYLGCSNRETMDYSVSKWWGCYCFIR